jgi:molybdopterin-dependent oxidoreductase alpha subunit
MSRKPSFTPYDGPAGGWGSARSVRRILTQEGVLASGALALTRQNKPDGFQCSSCSWSKPANPLPAEFCENGAKATAWEITSHRCTPEVLARHTVTEMLGWDDYHLERLGRLTHPTRYDPVSDTYVAVSWDAAFAEIGREIRAVADPKRTVFYSSGRMSNEASYMYALMARMYGNNNLPDSSNMCHETTSVALPESIGVPVGTVTLDDFAKTDCILFFGQNVGSNSPRMLHPLQAASKRGVPIVTFNPLRERGLERFTNPQSPVEMALRQETRISSAYHQVKAGGDLAAITGICKFIIEMDDAAAGAGGKPILDHAFIAEHCSGFDALAVFLRAQSWSVLEEKSGLPRETLQETAITYARGKAVMAIYGMGLTQHRNGVETVRMLVNLLLLRGNIGRPGAGICPVRGHSNVQGQRTVGITEKVKLAPNENLKRQFGFTPPVEDGLNTVEACEAILEGKVDAFVMFGGNFLRAIPDHHRMEPAWRRMRLTINVATKLNRSHLVPGAISFILPPIARAEIDMQASGPQSVSMEDSLACVHGSRGVRQPASRHLLSEPKIVAELAKQILPANPSVDWDEWVGDYSRVRAAISETYPDIFADYETRMWVPGGFHRDLPARSREWKTDSGKANFSTPSGLDEDDDMPEIGSDVLRLMTLRSNDQFNTTVYGYDDRFRGINGTRMVVMMNRADIARLGLREGDNVKLRTSSSRDDFTREVTGFRVTPYDIPAGCIGAYYPEANPLIPIWHYAKGSKVPAAKSIPVQVLRA